MEDYIVPGDVPAIAQPSYNTCWITAATYMVSWHEKAEFTIDEVLKRVSGDTEKYAQLIANDEGLPQSDEQDFMDKLGLIREDATDNISAEDWLFKLKQYGFLWVATVPNVWTTSIFHVIIIKGITNNGTLITYIDPDDGLSHTMNISDLNDKLKITASLDGKIRVCHFPNNIY
ncbi:papain-like cysteine protease family protein [Bacillus cereus]|uniref:papain-like cysteine protease family protein n=1 Tax=Bacillus cereus TaxID=1396 RepID=UPI003635DC94